jgi:predicted ATPase
MAERSLAVANSLNDPFSLALTHYFASAAAQIVGDVTLATRYAEAGLQIATEHDLALPRAWSAGVLGWCVAEAGDAERGTKLLTEAIAALEAMHSHHFQCYLLGLLGQTHMAAGRHADAMKAVEDGIALAGTSRERYYNAELHRLRGELLARPPRDDPRKAEAAFRTAIEIARQQGATRFEQKAMASLRRWCG